jgi:hypothetical protein
MWQLGTKGQASCKMIVQTMTILDQVLVYLKNILVVGAVSSYSCYHRGFASIFERDEISCNWDQTAKFLSYHCFFYCGGLGYDYFEASVGVSGNICGRWLRLES